MCLVSMAGRRSRTISRPACRLRATHNHRCRCHNSSRTTWTPATRWVSTPATNSSSSRSQCPTSTAAIRNHRLRSRWEWWLLDSLAACRCRPVQDHRCWGRQLRDRWLACQCSQEADSTCLPGVGWCSQGRVDKARWDRHHRALWAIQCRRLDKCRQDSTQTMGSRASSEYQLDKSHTQFISQMLPSTGFKPRVHCRQLNGGPRLPGQMDVLSARYRFWSLSQLEMWAVEEHGKFRCLATDVVNSCFVITIIIIIVTTFIVGSRTAFTCGTWLKQLKVTSQLHFWQYLRYRVQRWLCATCKYVVIIRAGADYRRTPRPGGGHG